MTGDCQGGHGGRWRGAVAGSTVYASGSWATGYGASIVGLDDGRVWAASLKTQKLEPAKAEKGPPITALAVSGRRLAWGDEEGGAGVTEVPDL